ncbi:putative Late nodulin [Medicago truncatula]|uniref:Late nodulin n=1 Tax=Medicago truncatula TaxID=3880 RepID=A0A072VAW3_MEDTR|nr:late nodulin [Medicago truncatula]RHN75127.1 putative Late nodulin [Medicago truncatula]
MTLLLKFLYALIIFISLLFVVTNGAQFLCSDDSDCPRDLCVRNSLTLRCVNYICQCR